MSSVVLFRGTSKACLRTQRRLLLGTAKGEAIVVVEESGGFTDAGSMTTLVGPVRARLALPAAHRRAARALHEAQWGMPQYSVYIGISRSRETGPRSQLEILTRLAADAMPTLHQRLGQRFVGVEPRASPQCRPWRVFTS